MNTDSTHPYDQYYSFLKVGWKVSNKFIDLFLANYSVVNLNINQRRILAVIFGDLIQRPVDRLIAITTNGEIPQYEYNPSGLTNRKILTVFEKLVEVGCLIHLPHDPLSSQRRSARYQLTEDFHATLASLASLLHNNIESYDSGSTYNFIRFRHLAERDHINSDKRVFIPPPYPITKDIKKKNEILRKYNRQMYHWKFQLPDKQPAIPNPLYSNFIGNKPSVVGRIQGGYLNSFTKEERTNLIMGGEDTVYLDFQGFNTRALYAVNELQYGEDPYDIDNVSRNRVKAMATVIMNVDNDQSARNAAIKNHKDSYPDDGVISFEEAGTILQSYKVKHPDISEQFLDPSVAPRLQSLEAEVAFTVVDVFISEDKPILPIHDGFVVKESDEHLLKDTMVEAYSRVFNGISPVVTKD